MKTSTAGSVDGTPQNGGGNDNQASDMPFPWKLHQILEYAEGGGGAGVNGHPENLQAIVSWLPSGKAFKVHQPAEFAKRIMPLYFRSAEFKSFQRNLSVYRFQRIDTDSVRGAYRHELFVRENRDLCHHIIRRPSASGGYGAVTTTGGPVGNVTFASGVEGEGAHRIGETVWETGQDMQYPPHGSGTAWCLTNTMSAQDEQDSPTYSQPEPGAESTHQGDRSSNSAKRKRKSVIEDYCPGATSSSRWASTTAASLPHPPPTTHSVDFNLQQSTSQLESDSAHQSLQYVSPIFKTSPACQLLAVASSNSNIIIIKPAAKIGYLNSAALVLQNAQFAALEAIQQQQEQGKAASTAPAMVHRSLDMDAPTGWVAATPLHPISRYRREMKWVFFFGTHTPSSSSYSSNGQPLTSSNSKQPSSSPFHGQGPFSSSDRSLSLASINGDATTTSTTSDAPSRVRQRISITTNMASESGATGMPSRFRWTGASSNTPTSRTTGPGPTPAAGTEAGGRGKRSKGQRKCPDG